MPTRGGQFRNLVQLQSRSTTVDSTYGSQNQTWTTYATVYADIQPLTGAELLAAQAVQSEVTHTVTVYWTPNFTPKAADRIVLGVRIFDIRSVVNDQEANRLFVMSCVEGLTQG